MVREQTTLVFLPAPPLGHVLATLEFGMRLLDVKSNINIHVLLITMPIFPSIDAHIQSLVDAQPRLKVSKLPMVEPPPLDNIKKSMEKFLCDFIDSHATHVRSSISEIVAGSAYEGFRIAGVVLDLFTVSMVDVVNELSLSPYVFFTSGAGLLSFSFYLGASKDETSAPYKFSDPDCLVPGFRNPVPVNVLPAGCFNNEGGFHAMLNVAKRVKEVKGIIVNTFEELEEFMLNSSSGGMTTMNPSVFAVGPLISFKGFPTANKDDSKLESMMEWLDEQPDSSVVFLCFGSGGSDGFITESLVREIALGLEQSKQRFLWQMRPPNGKTAEDVLPEGFMERTKGKGMICGWVKQVDVLAHTAIGGFVSHCGWNSTLESIWYGVPIATLPFGAEQQLNAFQLVKELGMSVELKIDHRPGVQLVSADDVEKAVVELMDEESEVRKKVKEMSIAARKAVSEGGSSSSSLAQFADKVFGCA